MERLLKLLTAWAIEQQTVREIYVLPSGRRVEVARLRDDPWPFGPRDAVNYRCIGTLNDEAFIIAVEPQ